MADAGYRPEQVSRILITHKHADHTGELRCFPNAKIYASVEECESEELRRFPNLVPVAFCRNGYANFPAAEKITEGVWFVEAKGHTSGNSIVIVEDDGLYYMIHGDVTLHQSIKVDTKKIYYQIVFSKVGIYHIFAKYRFTKVDIPDIFQVFSFSKVDTGSECARLLRFWTNLGSSVRTRDAKVFFLSSSPL